MPAPLTLLRAIIAAEVVFSLGGCTALGIGTPADAASESCTDSPIAASVLWDASGTSAGEQIYTERIEIVRDVVRRTALCNGRFRLSLFSGSTGAASNVFDGNLHIVGATDQAKLRKADKYVSGIVADIEKGFQAAVSSLPEKGSDIVAVLRLGSEYQSQFPNHQLDLYVLTDGFDNGGADVDAAKSPESVVDLANTVVVPELDGAWVTFAGLGRVADGSGSSAQAETLVSFFTAVCKRSAAASCSVVTDYVSKW